MKLESTIQQKVACFKSMITFRSLLKLDLIYLMEAILF